MKRQFDYADYIVFIIIILISVFIGLYQGIKTKYGEFFKICFTRKVAISNDEASFGDGAEEPAAQKDEKSKVKEYLQASSSMSALPVAFSLVATFFSSTSLLGYPAEIYQYGIQYWISVIGICLPIILGAYLFGPMFSKLKVLSVFEYFLCRFKVPWIRTLGVVYYLLRILIGMGIVIYGPSTTLSIMTGVRPEVSIAIIGVVATFYTTIGGIKAVIYSDAFQLTIMFIGLITIIAKGTYDIGGFSELWRINSERGRLNLFNFNPNPLIRQSFWPLVFGNFVSWLFPYCVDQQMVQRFASAKSIKTAQTALLLNIPGVIFLVSFCCFTGLVIFANYADCDPLSVKNITGVTSSNQLVPYFVMDRLGSIPGASGLFLGSIFCAALSSLSSALNSMSAIILQDFLKRFTYFKNLDDAKSAYTAKIIVLVCGVICTCNAFLISQLPGNLIQINNSINGSLGAPVIALFILGTFFPFANAIGAAVGTLVGLGVGLWINLGAYIVSPVYPKLNVTVKPECFNNYSVTTASTTTVASMSTTPLIFDQHTNYYRFNINEGEATNLSGFNKFYSISYVWYSALSVIIAVVIGVIVSLITIKYNKVPDDDTLIIKSCKIKSCKQKPGRKTSTESTSIELK